MGDAKRKAANAEVKKLLQARFIREVTYTTWLANVVLVRKSNGKWRMCTDYTDLNKACPKDAYPLPCIDRLGDKISPMTKLLRKASAFSWNELCEEAFLALKASLATPPILTRPDPSFPLLVYLAVSDEAISSVLVQDKEGTQAPIYFVSRLLQDAETRYQLIEKVALGLVHTSRRLRHYFQSHRVVIHTDCPISKVLGKPELAGRMMAWSVELSQFDITYKSRGPIKAQCLADFINKLHPHGHFEEQWWTLHVDGSSNCQGSGAGVILEGPKGLTLEQSLRFRFKASNNQAEYEALLAGLRLAEDMGASRIKCLTDSKVVAEQVLVEHIPREDNTRADYVEEMVANVDTDLPSQSNPSDWREEIKAFITKGAVPADPTDAKRLRTQASKYVVIAGLLYRRGFSTPLLKCLSHAEAEYVTREVHEGICGTHSGARMTVAKLLRAGYYWPTMNTDCEMFVKKCQPCQKHGNLIHRPAEHLHSSLGIQHKVTSVEHPQTNGQAESANKVILTELKKRLGEAKGAWAEQLPEVLWAYRCTPQSTTQETPFRLVYGSDAMIPVEIGEPSFRRAHFNESNNDTQLRVNLDIVENIRERAQVVAEATKQRYKRRFDSRVKLREFREGDLVWRATGEARKDPRQGKLAPNWDGPFRIRHNLNNGAYKLEYLSGEPISRTWNSSHLKVYYS
uniref:Retrovirus-related Pol polyprotein from transposon 17.6 n=1 Tax=Cajanus cajan TaxID=3821 RepID=A0A151RAW2_CAJCA|nr:Retrovirus-related Pol polyprotein from transposon 17.6 [Cajanus cajan]